MSSPPPPDPAAASAQAAMAAAFQKFAVEAWVLFGVAVLVTLLRTYARIKSVGIRNLQADDYLVWVGVVRLSGHRYDRGCVLKKLTY